MYRPEAMEIRCQYGALEVRSDAMWVRVLNHHDDPAVPILMKPADARRLGLHLLNVAEEFADGLRP